MLIVKKNIGLAMLIGLVAGINVLSATAIAQPIHRIDLATASTTDNTLLRVYGSSGNGSYGVPVAGGFDVNDDTFPDYALAAMQADITINNITRNNAGEVFLVFGNGTINGTVDTATVQTRVLRIAGAASQENTGSEIWMDDVTGDGIGDLLICRQNHTPSGGPIGAGALTILKGGSEIQTYADTLSYLDLAAPPPELTVFTFTGRSVQDRLCIWTRTGDVSGDGIADIIVGADQAGTGSNHTGEAYLIRGGSHLAVNQTIDLADFGSTPAPLAGHLLRINPPLLQNHMHFGATCQIADLDGNGRAEILIAATLNRAGAVLAPLNATEDSHGSGGITDGTVYIAWDDNIPNTLWPDNFEFTITDVSITHTSINGYGFNRNFGEEILGGLDYDNNGNADLFIGDLTGTGPGKPAFSGMGHIIYDAALLKNQTIDFSNPQPGITTTTIYGTIFNAISADTAMHGDFDNNGIDDLAFSSPHDAPFGRVNAGTLHILQGQNGPWPSVIDLANIPLPAQIAIVEIYGANGTVSGNTGDTLAYSGAAGDIDNDGKIDILTNEMVGDGNVPGTIDVGNLIILSGKILGKSILGDNFEE